MKHTQGPGLILTKKTKQNETVCLAFPVKTFASESWEKPECQIWNDRFWIKEVKTRSNELQCVYGLAAGRQTCKNIGGSLRCGGWNKDLILPQAENSVGFSRCDTSCSSSSDGTLCQRETRRIAAGATLTGGLDRWALLHLTAGTAAPLWFLTQAALTETEAVQEGFPNSKRPSTLLTSCSSESSVLLLRPVDTSAGYGFSFTSAARGRHLNPCSVESNPAAGFYPQLS